MGSVEELNEYLEKNYKESIKRMFDDGIPEGIEIITTVETFFDKGNSMYDIEDSVNLDYFVRFLTDTYQEEKYDLQDDFFLDLWFQIIEKHIPVNKTQAIKEFSYYAFQASKYWDKINVLDFSIKHLGKDEKLIQTEIHTIFQITLKEWNKKDDNWKIFAERFINILNDNSVGKEFVDIEKIQNALETYKKSVQD